MSRARGIFIGVAAAAIFGVYPSAARLAYRDGVNASFLIVASTFARAASLVALCVASGKPFHPFSRVGTPYISGGFFQALTVFGLIGSLVYLPGPVTTVIVFTHTVMLLLLLWAKGEMALTWSALSTSLVALAGISLVVDMWSADSPLSVFGLALAFGAAVATASRLYVFGKQLQTAHPLTVGSQVFTYALLFTLPVWVVLEPQIWQTAIGCMWTVLACASLAIGTFGTFYGIAALGSFQFSLVIKIEPVFTALLAVALAGETLKTSQYLGMGLVMGALATYQVANRKAGAP